MKTCSTAILVFLILHTATNTPIIASCRKISASPQELAKTAAFVARQTNIKAITAELKKVQPVATALSINPNMLRELYLKCQSNSYQISGELATWLSDNNLLSSHNNLKASWKSSLWDKHSTQPPFTELILKTLHYVGRGACDADSEEEPFDARTVYAYIAVEDILKRHPEMITLLRNAIDALDISIIDPSTQRALYREYKLIENVRVITLVELDRIVRIADTLSPRPTKAKRHAPKKRPVSLPLDIDDVIELLEALKFGGEPPKPSTLAVLPLDRILSMEKSIDGNPYSLVIRPT